MRPSQGRSAKSASAEAGKSATKAGGPATREATTSGSGAQSGEADAPEDRPTGGGLGEVNAGGIAAEEAFGLAPELLQDRARVAVGGLGDGADRVDQHRAAVLADRTPHEGGSVNDCHAGVVTLLYQVARTASR